MQEKDDFKALLLKKANGYDVQEVVEEFNEVNGELVLTKKKVTHKHIPPDSAMLKLLLENKDKTEFDDLSQYSEAELRALLDKVINDEEGV